MCFSEQLDKTDDSCTTFCISNTFALIEVTGAFS